MKRAETGTQEAGAAPARSTSVLMLTVPTRDRAALSIARSASGSGVAPSPCAQSIHAASRARACGASRSVTMATPSATSAPTWLAMRRTRSSRRRARGLT